MFPRFFPTGVRTNHHAWPLLSTWLVISVYAWALPGCEEQPRHVAKRPRTRALDQTGITVDADVENDRSQPQAAPPQATPPAKPSGPIIGQRTTDIRDAGNELRHGGAQIATTRITAKDYITLQGNAYVTIVGRTSELKIKHAMDLYHATNERYPKDLDEFMAEIIKPNGVALPQLPPYQKYGYDDKEHKLVILEYPDLKNQPGPR